MTDQAVTDAIDAVVEAALEHALVADDDARQYFALAGILEESEADGRGDVLSAALLCTLSVRALAHGLCDTGLDATAWSPGARDPRTEFVAIGARAALRRFDVERDTVSARAGLDASALDLKNADSSTRTLDEE